MRRTALRSGVGRKGKFGRRGPEGGDIPAHEFAVQREGLAGRALQAQRDFNVAARHFFFQQAAQLHLQGIGAGRKAEVQIEKTMIDGLQRQRERHAAVGGSRGGGERGTSAGRLNFALTWAKPVIERMGIGAVLLKFLLQLWRIGAGELQFVEAPIRT